MIIKEVIDLFEPGDGFLVLENVLKMDKMDIILNQNMKIPKSKEKEIKEIYEKYKSHTPINYILGNKNFYGRDFYLEDGVLIPRFETEILIENILSLDKDFKNILDIGCGSGIISITLALEIKDSEVLGVDVSDKALEISNINRDRLKAKNCHFIRSDLFSNVGDKKFDLIVSNPPYITKEDMEKLDEKVKNEPHLALYGGEDGLFFYRRIVTEARTFLNKGGYLAFEIGYDQGVSVPKLMEENGFEDITLIKDYNGFDRCVIGRYNL